MAYRFKDTGQTIYDFCHEFLVHCPRCNSCARVVPRDNTDTSCFASRRVFCATCGYTQDWEKQAIAIGDSFDWYFRLPLWLQTPCCGKTLWAYNKDHLDFLESFVKAGLRERAHPGITEHGPLLWRNTSLASRLPAWIKSAKNREEVLKGIKKLRQMIE